MKSSFTVPFESMDSEFVKHMLAPKIMGSGRAALTPGEPKNTPEEEFIFQADEEELCLSFFGVTYRISLRDFLQIWLRQIMADKE